MVGQHFRDVRTDRERTFEMLRRLRVSVEAEQRHSQLNVRLRLPGKHRDRVLQWFDCLAKAPERHQHRPAADQIRRRRPVTRQQLVVIAQRVAVAAGQDKGHRTIVQCLRILGLDRERRIITLDCLGQALEFHQRIAPVAVRSCGVRLQRQRTVEAAQRLLLPSLSRGQDAEVMVCGSQAGVERNGLGEASESIVHPPHSLQSQPKLQMRRGILHRQTHGVAAACKRLLAPAQGRQRRGANPIPPAAVPSSLTSSSIAAD